MHFKCVSSFKFITPNTVGGVAHRRRKVVNIAGGGGGQGSEYWGGGGGARGPNFSLAKL